MKHVEDICALQDWLNGSSIRIMTIAQIQRENLVRRIHENTLGEKIRGTG